MAYFITFEGLDGSGKSTHLSRASGWLVRHGIPLRCTKEPGGTSVGEGIRGIFLDPERDTIDSRVEAMMVFASRRQNLVEVIEPSLEAGLHVLCDRFTDSTLAYQGVGRGLPEEWILALDELATGGRRPDFTLLFDLPAEVALGRGQSSERRKAGAVDRIDKEGLAFYEKVRGAYLAMVEAEPERFRVVNSAGTKEETWAEVEQVLREIFELEKTP
jgi:dTMP kinase